MQEQQELSERASRLAEALEKAALQRPVFVEFSGSPKSGKSTCIEIVRHFFRRHRIKVLAPAEGASRRTPYYLKDDLMAFNTWSASYALMHVLEGLHGSDRYALAILDRGLFDALAWFELLAQQRKITLDERDRVQQFLQIGHWRSAIDAVLLFTTDPDTSMTRENQDKLVDDPGQAMNKSFLTELNNAYAEVETKYSTEFGSFRRFDTSAGESTGPKATAKEVVEVILTILQAKVDDVSKGG